MSILVRLLWAIALSLLAAGLSFSQPPQAPPVLAQAPPVSCNCYETGDCVCGRRCECEWCDYLAFVRKSQMDKAPLVVFVGFDAVPESFGQLTGCYRICLTRFPGVTGRAVVVGRWVGRDQIRTDLAATASVTQIRLAAGLITPEPYHPPSVVPYYSQAIVPTSSPVFGGGFGGFSGGGGC